MEKIVGPDGRAIGYLTFVERMMEEAAALGVRLFYGHKLTGTRALRRVAAAAAAVVVVVVGGGGGGVASRAAAPPPLTGGVRLWRPAGIEVQNATARGRAVSFARVEDSVRFALRFEIATNASAPDERVCARATTAAVGASPDALRDAAGVPPGAADLLQRRGQQALRLLRGRVVEELPEPDRGRVPDRAAGAADARALRTLL
eukprot:scaffold827_cov369-Prasinococcus_capsulatus_cf.AAC.27